MWRAPLNFWFMSSQESLFTCQSLPSPHSPPFPVLSTDISEVHVRAQRMSGGSVSNTHSKRISPFQHRANWIYSSVGLNQDDEDSI